MLKTPHPPAPSVSVRVHTDARDGAPAPVSRRATWLASLTKHEAKSLRHIGLRVRAARLRRRMSRAELAVAAGHNAAHVGTIERGENNTTLLSLSRLADALAVELGEFVRAIR